MIFLLLGVSSDYAQPIIGQVTEVTYPVIGGAQPELTPSKRQKLGQSHWHTVYPKKYAHGFCFAVLCCGYTLTDFPISIRLTSLALWQSNDCPSASKATLMNMDKYFMWIHYERLRNHNKAKHNKTVCIFLGIYCIYASPDLNQPETISLKNIIHNISCLLQYTMALKELPMATSSNENIFFVTGPLCREFTGHHWIPLTKAGDTELWCFLWSVPKQMVE